MDTRTTEFSLGFAVELGVVAFKGLPWPTIHNDCIATRWKKSL